MTTSFQPIIDRIIEVAQTAAGTDGRTIPLSSFRFDANTEKDPSLTAQNALVRPVFEIEDLIPRDIDGLSENASLALYEIDVRLRVTYKVNTTLPDVNRNALVGLMRDDLHKIRRALGNPETFDQEETGLASGMLEFVSASGISWRIADGIASQVLTFSGKVFLDYV
jgi:hypothetical protein